MQHKMEGLCRLIYLLVCSSGGVPTAFSVSVLGSEGVLSTFTPADPDDPVGDVAPMWR